MTALFPEMVGVPGRALTRSAVRAYGKSPCRPSPRRNRLTVNHLRRQARSVRAVACANPGLLRPAVEQSYRLVRRGIQGCFVIVAATTACEPSSPVQVPQVAGTWTAAAVLPQARTEVSVATDGASIYLAGGFRQVGSGVDAPREVFRYDPVSDRWTTPTLLPQGVNHAGMAFVAGRLFVVGGFQGTSFTPTSAVRIWNPATGSWTGAAPLPTPRGALAVVVRDGRIHAIGGNAPNAGALDPDEHSPALDGSSVGTHEVYDPGTNTWTRLAPMPTGRNHLAAAVVDGRIHAVGGRVGNSFTLTVHEVFDPSTGVWVSGPPIPTGRSGIAAAALDGRLYVFGGETIGTVERTFDEVERYDPLNQSWFALPRMPTPRHGLGAAVVDGRIYVMAGGPLPGFAFSAVNEVLLPHR